MAYEHRTKISGRREDALYGTVIIEYKAPKKLAGAEFEKAISVLYEALEKSKASRTEMLFRDWKRVFSQVCAYSPGKLEGLVEHYGVAKGKKVDVERLMFAVHTYYTLVMKLFLTLLAVPGRSWCRQ